MKKSLTVEELKAIRPRRGRVSISKFKLVFFSHLKFIPLSHLVIYVPHLQRIINEKHERILNGEKVEQESFLNDVTVNDEFVLILHCHNRH